VLFLAVKKLLRDLLLARNGAGIVRNARNKSGIFSPETGQELVLLTEVRKESGKSQETPL
jgi:hypothetical protein